MRPDILETAVNLTEKVKYILIASSDSKGLPHVAVAGEVTFVSGDHIIVKGWFCPGTVANLQENNLIALVVWDAHTDKGYQLLGEAEKVEDLAMLDGYAPVIEDKSPLPQVERQLVMRVDKIIEFKHAPHSDIEK